MAEEIERLVVGLEARFTNFEKQMAKASGIATRRMGEIEKRSNTMANRLGQVGSGAFAGFARGAALTLAPILSVGAAINTAKAALSDFDKIAKQAKAGALDPEAFQEYAYAAELGGVATDEFAKALETFARNAGQASAGKGRMVAQVKALNPELLKNIMAAETQEERLRLVADALDQEADATRKAAIATTVFGDSGARMVEVLKGGSAALDQTAQAARSLGIIIDRELLARAETLNDEFETATKVMDLQFKHVLIELAPLLISTAQLASGLATAIRQVVDAFKDMEGRSTQTLRDRAETIRSLLAQNAGTSTRTDSQGMIMPGNPMSVAIPSGQAVQLEAELAAIEAVLKGRDAVKPDLPTGGGGGGDRGASADAALRQAEAVKALIADLQFEQSTIGMTARELAVANALRQAGAAATDEQRQKIEELVVANFDMAESMAANIASMEAFRDIASDTLGDFVQGLRDGLSLSESLGNALTNLGNKLLDAGLNLAINAALNSLTGGVGGTAVGAVGSIFGGFRANGGSVSAGRAYVVGEKGPELMMPGQNGRIIPNLPAPAGAAAGGGGKLTITLGPGLEASMLDQAAQQSVQIVQSITPQMINRQAPTAVAQSQRNRVA